MDKAEQLLQLFKLCDKIKNNEIELLDMKDKYNKDLTWNINLKIRIHKEVEEFKKHTITIKK